jgi:hypothetical protein
LTVPKGRYQPVAAKAGFARQWFREAPQSETGLKSEENLRVPLLPLGVVEGKVLDQDGEPIRYAHITALQRTHDNGILRYRTVRQVATDDLGEFRLWNLPPGDYFVRAEGRSGGTAMTGGDSVTGGTRVLETFHSLYADGARDLAGSSPTRIDYGASVKAEFRVHMEPAFVVAGTLTGVAKGELPSFELIRDGVPVSRHRAVYLPLNNRFEIYDVPSGKHIFRISTKSSSQDVALQVAGASLTNVAWSLPEPASPRSVELVIRSQDVEVRSTGALPLPRSFDIKQRNRPSLTPCNPQLLPINPFSIERPAWSKPSPEGTGMRVENLAPGRYQVVANCGFGYVVPSNDVRDAVSNGLWFIDVAADGPAVTRVEANFFYSGASVEVKCSACRDVLFVPAEESQTALVQLMHCFQTCGSATLAPGEYRILGFDRRSDDGLEGAFAYRDPKTLAALQGGMRISVSKGDRKTIEITELSK